MALIWSGPRALRFKKCKVAISLFSFLKGDYARDLLYMDRIALVHSTQYFMQVKNGLDWERKSRTKFNKRSMDLGALLDGCSWYDIGNFCRLVNQLNLGLTVTQYQSRLRRKFRRSLEKLKQNCEKSKIQNSKNPKQLFFCEDHSEKKSEKVWKDSKVIWGRSSVLKFWLP